MKLSLAPVAAVALLALAVLQMPPVSAQAPVVGQPGVVAAYGFEEGTGTTTQDATGNGNTGTLANATWSTNGRFGKGLSFNGTNSRVTIPSAAVLDMTIGLTLEAWVRPTTLTNWRTVIMKEMRSDLAYALYAHNGSRPAAWLNLGSTRPNLNGAAALTAGTWTHLATTFAGGTMRLYVNGTQVSSRTASGTIQTSTRSLSIGGNSVWGEYFNGLIDEVRIYGRALSAGEIQADMAAPVSALVMSPGSTCPCSIWSPAAMPTVADGGDTSAVELGMKFKADTTGSITAIRFYKAPTNIGTHVGKIWTAGGTLLGSVTFTNETASGWQQATFQTPIQVSANTTYVASYFAPAGHYSADRNYFATAVDTPPLHALANTTSVNGLYKYTPTGAFPDQTFQAANYWVDVVYVDSDIAPPQVTGIWPASNGTALPLGTTVRATFNENIDATSISSSTLELRRVSTNQVLAASYSFDSGTLTATITPSANLLKGETYGVTVRGGSVDPRVKDVAGNGLAAAVTWSFTAENDQTPPAVAGMSPLGGTSDVSQAATVSVLFSEAIDPSTITTATFELRDGASQVVPAAVSYSPATRTATLVPAAPLSAASIFTVAVRGGATDPRVKDLVGNALVSTAVWSFTTTAATTGCACSLWPSTTVPANPVWNDPASANVGVRFMADRAGSITALRFYKGSGNTGTHVGSLWSSTGQLLASVVFTAETATGWQQANLSAPVTIEANVVYVASYLAPVGRYAVNSAYFGAQYDMAPLRALASGNGGNGVYTYNGSTAFPASSAGGTNFWVDVVFIDVPPTDLVKPQVTTVSPAINATGVLQATAVTATFNEPMNATTVNSSTFELRNGANPPVAATVTYNAATRTATLVPSFTLNGSTTYTATLRGGATDPRVKDVAQNALASDYSWSFTTSAVPANEGPGGPVLVIASATNPFGRYYGEILRAEGLNFFTLTDISSVLPATLTAYDVVIVGEMPLTAAQVTMFSDWVNAGGRLILMRPDKQLATLAGLTDAAGTIANQYLAIAASGPGIGIVNETIQFHGTADLYTLNGATSLATFYSNATTATTNPAVTRRTVGAGQVATFAFDLARSIVYTRQGNPAWAGQERDGMGPRRSNDLFFGNAVSDPQPDWVDLNKVGIPQADEQQRFLANLVLQMNTTKKPLPRFWYLPNGFRAAVVMTGDDHGNGGTAGRWEAYKAASPANCSVDDWECIRGTSYVYTTTPLTNAQAVSYEAEGFEVALHLNTNCNDYTASSLQTSLSTQLVGWGAKYTGVSMPNTNRTHCIVWSDWATQAKVSLANGIRFDTNYYYWPGTWVQNRPGFFTGSAMPMRFADLDGSPIDVYQAATQMNDEADQTFPFTIDTLLARATGPLGYYGVFTANMHTDAVPHAGSDAIVNTAKAYGAPVVSARQMLKWLDGRNSSSFGSFAYADGVLTFKVKQGGGADNLLALLPYQGPFGTLTSLTWNGFQVEYSLHVVKGMTYAVFFTADGNYRATY